MDSDVFGMLIFFGFLAAVIIVPIYLRERTRQSAHQLISQAMEKGQALDPALLRQITDMGNNKPQQDRPRRTLGSAIVLLALAGGFAGTAFLMGGFDPSGHAQNGMLVPAVILAALGVAFLLLALVDYMAKKKGE